MPKAQTKKEKGFTYGEYIAWSDNKRWELIEGVPFDMTPAPGRGHSKISIALLEFFIPFFKGKPCEVHHAPFDVRLPEGEEADEIIKTVVQPDILVVCDQQKLDEKGCRGAPDLVVEILSPSSASRDCVAKRRVYEKHGVKEFWTVDPTNRMVQVYILGKEKEYRNIQTYGDEDVFESSVFKGLKIDLSKIFPFKPKGVKQGPEEYLLS